MTEAKTESYEAWNAVAPGWDRHRESMAADQKHVAEWLVDRAGITSGMTALDIAAGPGHVTFVAAERVGPSGKILCTDFAPAMVEVARSYGADLGATNVEYRVMDAEAMDLPDASVDAATCRFGFMLMPNQDAALREARRVLRPDAKLAFAVWGPPERNPWATSFGFVMVSKGLMEMRDPTAPGGMFSLADPARIRDLTAEAGFTSVEIEDIETAMRFRNFDDAWQTLSDVSGPLALAIQALTSEQREDVRSEVRAMTEQFAAADGSLVLPAVAVGVCAS